MLGIFSVLLPLNTCLLRLSEPTVSEHLARGQKRFLHYCHQQQAIKQFVHHVKINLTILANEKLLVVAKEKAENS